MASNSFSMNGSVSPMCPTTICNSGWVEDAAENHAEHMNRRLDMPAHPAPAIIWLTSGSSPRSRRRLTGIRPIGSGGGRSARSALLPAPGPARKTVVEVAPAIWPLMTISLKPPSDDPRARAPRSPPAGSPVGSEARPKNHAGRNNGFRDRVVRASREMSSPPLRQAARRRARSATAPARRRRPHPSPRPDRRRCRGGW